jgi:predicted transcriptional regulator
MKKLIISIKSASESLDQFAKALEKARKNRNQVHPHFEISFDNRKDFNRFISNIFVLEAIRAFKPTSVYDLANKMSMDHSNLNKIILFYENLGALVIKEKKNKGRLLKMPVVEYDAIEFKLGA